MIFYEIHGRLNKLAELESEPSKWDTFEKGASKELFGNNLNVSKENLPIVQAAVDKIAAITMPLKMRIDINDLRADSFCFVVISNFDALKKYSINQITKKLLQELRLTGEITGTEEITESNYISLLSLAERIGYCTSFFEIKFEFGLDDKNRDFTYIERKLEKINYGMIKSKQPSLQKVTEYADRLACENLTDEIKRIAANKKYGTPVHYIIQMEKMDSCREVYNFLLDHLKRNGRILRNIVHVWSNEYQNRFERIGNDDFQKIFNKSEFGAVIIKSNFMETGGDDAPLYYKTIKQVSAIIKSNKKNVLTILCMEKGADKQKKAWLDHLENMTFVTIKEKTVFEADAKKYILSLAEKDGLQSADGLFQRINSDTGYTRRDLDLMYSDFYSDYQKRIMFPEYKDFAVIQKKPEAKVEGIAYEKLKKMIGLHDVKEQIERIINFAKIQKMTEGRAEVSNTITKHMVFTGAPGTAKTTVARLFAQIMKDNALLTSGIFVETGRADLVGEYVGHTATKVRDKFKEAKGGVLLIDEAYSLVDDRRGLFGDEAINTIVQEMENNRDNIIVIFAGYKAEMENFIERNSGLKSRVAHYVDFPDYNEYELIEILKLMVQEQGLKLSCETDEMMNMMKKAATGTNFGNGRFVRNLLDQARLKQASRVIKSDNPSLEDMLTLQAEDFELPYSFSSKSKIGFECK